MQRIAIIDNYLKTRYLFFKWRYGLAFVNKIAMAFGMACVTGLLAQSLYSFTVYTCAITGQVLGVLLSGVVCGGAFGSISQIIYLGLGIVGVPWFAGGASGNIFLLSGSGGYIIGFVFAPLVIGRYSDRYIGARTFLSQLKFMMLGV
ncbi:MAG: biotin transporter BioY, partial [Thermotogota bacterium]|nr:biotin transporter BioY [Thermotogota bacterium]